MSKKSPVTPAIKTTACDGGFFNGMEFRGLIGFIVKMWGKVKKLDTWAIMDKAFGKDFQDLLPENKKTVAKAVVTMEFANMLSGHRFDSDRHSGQYKIDENTNTIGIFDTDSISIVEPTEKEKSVLANTVKKLGNANSSLGEILCTEIEKVINVHYNKK